MKLNYLLLSSLFFLFYGNQPLYAQEADSSSNRQTDVVVYRWSNADYIWVNDTVIGSGREVNLSDYHNDTLKAYYSVDWHTCLPALAKYITYAVKEGDFWHCIDYYADNGKTFRTGFFKDQKLTKPVGPFRCYYKDGQLAKAGAFKKGKRNGKWREYFSDGRLCFATVYKNNYKTGFSVGINENNDSTLFHLNDFGEGYSDYHYANGEKRYHGKLGRFGVQDSLWCYYDSKERIWYTEMYKGGKLVLETCYDTTGAVMQDCITRDAVFRKGKNPVQKYLWNHIFFPKGYKLTKGPQRVVVTFAVEKDGTVNEIRVRQALHPAFDKAIIEALKKMPRWKSPGMNHNHIVKSYYVVPFNFSNY